jgi:glycyl-tRNA synthetase alpha chain
LRALGPEPWRAAYVQPSRRPADSRFGDNPYRLYRHYQYQVLLKPAPEDVQDLYLDSLRALGFDPRHHDVRFMEDDWADAALGASGMGWQVWLDGLEISQFTYFQTVGGMDLEPVSVELTYGLERIGIAAQKVDHYQDLLWNETLTYGDIHRQSEYDWGRFTFQLADPGLARRLFDAYEAEAARLLDAEDVTPAYDLTLKCAHALNLLDARGAVSLTQRAAYLARVRTLAHRCAQAYVRIREGQGFPLLAAR